MSFNLYFNKISLINFSPLHLIVIVKSRGNVGRTKRSATVGFRRGTIPNKKNTKVNYSLLYLTIVYYSTIVFS